MGLVAQIPCGNCGNLNDPSSQFCSNCGYFMAGGPTGTIPAYSNAYSATVFASQSQRITGTLAPGALLSGRYRVVEMVGKGGFGAVYKATDQRFQGRRVVAIKEMSDAHLSSQDKVQALHDFRQEADLLVQLKHPNLPDVSDFFEEGGKAYLVMEFVEGKTLEKVQEEIGHPLDEKLVMRWAIQLCDVLSCLHTQPQPIIFRDLKPSNVMVTKNGQIKLIDFGIARIFKSTSAKDTTTLGSRGYAPLEQYGHGQSDARSDIYALGATLYDLLTNSVPADSPMRRLSPQVFRRPGQLNPAISRDTEQIVLKAMAEEPMDRYQSATEMLQAIMSSSVLSANAAGQNSLPTFANAATIQASSQAFATQSATLPAPGGQVYGNTPQSLLHMQAQAPANQVMTTPPPGMYPPPGYGSPPPGQPRMSRRKLLVGGLVAAGALAAGGIAVSHFLLQKPVSVTLAYSTEKADWLTEMANAFNSQNKTLPNSNQPIQVTLENGGSLDYVNSIVQGDSTPVAFSPASDLERHLLDYKWNQKNNGQYVISQETDLSPRPLVYSPFVFAVWKSRADALLSKFGSIDWNTIHDALQLPHGWHDLNHGDWGSIKLGQTRSNRSNSGLLAIMLMAYAYTRKDTLDAGTINDPALWNKYIQVFEKAVNEWGDSSGTYLPDIVLATAPLDYAITMTYENLALRYQGDAQKSAGESLQIFYPNLNYVSTHPFVILDAPWVTDDQKQAAKQFRDFLLGQDSQSHAMKYGLRPSNNIQLTGANTSNTPLHQLSQLTRSHQFNASDSRAHDPTADVIEALISQWTDYNRDK